MKTAQATFNKKFIRIIGFFSVISIFLLSIRLVVPAFAQEETSIWQTRDNLSQSGTATNPRSIIDANGNTHVFWEDAFSGFVYTVQNGDGWAAPLSVAVPFSDPAYLRPSDPGFKGLLAPKLVTDNSERIHAVWLDDDSFLWYSRVLLADVPLGSGGWTFPRQLKSTVLEASIYVGGDDIVHLAYINLNGTSDTPAGIYYQQSVDSGETWSEPQLLYASAYLRGVSPEQINLSVGGGAETVQISWEDPLIEKVLYIRSVNGGVEWAPVIEIDQREITDSNDVPGPAQINQIVDGNTTHLIWRTGDPEIGCVLQHQLSEDGGDSWLPVEIIPSDSNANCPLNTWLIKGLNDSVWLLSAYQSDTFLQVWNGSEWSDQESQAALSSFINPQTFRDLSFDCWLPSVNNENDLVVVGCGTGVINDIWVRERPLGEIEAWFVEPETDWSKPEPFVATNRSIQDPVVVADHANQFHSFWVSDDLESEEQGNALYYSFWDQTEWSRTAKLFPFGGIRQVEASFRNDGRIVAVWHEETNELYYTQVNVDRAMFPADWTVPALLPFSQTGIGEFSLIIDDANRIYIAYAISVNEERGIYVTMSEDDGESWSDPVQVFDAEGAGWEKVDFPSLAVSGNGSLYLTWSQFEVTNPEPISLYYAYSNDNGENWSESELVVDVAVLWSDIVAIDKQRTIRLWQEQDEESSRIWHQVSFDNGKNWDSAKLIPGFEAKSGYPQTAVDVAGQLHLVQLQQDDEQMIQRWQWNEEGLIISEEFTLPEEDLMVLGIETAVDQDGNLGVVYAGETIRQDATISLLQFTSRQLDLPEQVATPVPTLVPTNTPQPVSATAEPELEVTPTPDFRLADRENSSPLGEVSMPVGIAIGVVPVLLIVLAVFGVRWFKTRS